MVVLQEFFFGLHKLIRSLIKYSFSIYIYIGVLIIINMILWKKIFNISWKQAQLEDAQESQRHKQIVNVIYGCS